MPCSSQPDPTVLCDAHALTVIDGRSELALRWENIAKVTAWKDDLFVIDRIAMGLWSADEAVVVVHENMTGFANLLDALKTKLPGFDHANWLHQVAFPAFARNEQVVWTRSAFNTSREC